MAIYIDTETTGLSQAAGDELVEVAVIDGHGSALLATLVNPGFPIPPNATEIHGITDIMVAHAPDADTVRERVAELVEDQEVVIYNAAFDRQFLNLSGAAAVHCCMRRYAERHGQWSDWHGDYKWQPLLAAASTAGHVWLDMPHRALADAQACRTVWRWLDGVELEARAPVPERMIASSACEPPSFLKRPA